jgi:hypothetical protein
MEIDDDEAALQAALSMSMGGTPAAAEGVTVERSVLGPEIPLGFRGK